MANEGGRGNINIASIDVHASMATFAFVSARRFSIVVPLSDTLARVVLE